MQHLEWILSKIQWAASQEGAHVRGAIQNLVDALLSLEGRGHTGTVFGMSSSSLTLSDEERATLIERIRGALVARHEASSKAGDTELVRELAALAEVCGIPALARVSVTALTVFHAAAAWLRDAASGVVLLRNTSEASAESVTQWLARTYKGPDFGGLDLVRDHTTADAWLMIGRWADCFDDDVQAAALVFLDAVRDACGATNAGASLGREGAASTLTFTNEKPAEVELVPWHAYDGVLTPRSGLLDEARTQQLLREVFPKLAEWKGLHAGVPHWLGLGVVKTDGRIRKVTPYVRVEFPGDGTMRVAALASEADFDKWLQAFLEAVDGPSPWWKVWN